MKKPVLLFALAVLVTCTLWWLLGKSPDRISAPPAPQASPATAETPPAPVPPDPRSAIAEHASVETHKVEATAAVRVVNAAHAPVAGSRVELVRIGSQPFGAGSPVIKPGDVRGGGPDGQPHELVSEGLTDENGVARLSVPPTPAKLGVRATGAGHVARVVAPARFPEDGTPLEVVVAAGGRIAGTVSVQGYPPGSVFLELDHERSRGYFQGPRIPVGPDGTFAGPSMASGTWFLYLSIDNHFDGGASELRFEPEVGHATVADGETVRLELDARNFAAAEITGTVLMNEAPPGLRTFLMLATSGRIDRFGPYTPDAQGQFHVQGLPPGNWGAEVLVGKFRDSEGERIDGDDWFTLAPAQDLRRDFVFERRRVVIHVLRADGTTPLASTEVQIQKIATIEVFKRTTDAAGRLVLDPAPSGEFRLIAARLMSGALRMPAGVKAGELDAVLRAP